MDDQLPFMEKKLTRIFDERAENGIDQTQPGMAHWAGTGPDGETCRTCQWFTFNGYYAGMSGGLKPSSCGKYRQLMRAKGPAIKHFNKACKYHEKNPNAPKAKNSVLA